MKNELIIQKETGFSPNQIAKIQDVWAPVPIGIRSLDGTEEFPRLIVTPTYDVGRIGKDTRGLAVRPETLESRYEIIVTDQLPPLRLMEFKNQIQRNQNGKKRSPS